MLKTRLLKVQMTIALGAILIAACGSGNVPEATPTLSVEQIAPVQTEAVSTFAAGLTLTALVLPSNTPTLTPAATTAVATSTGGTPFGAVSTSALPAGGGADDDVRGGGNVGGTHELSPCGVDQDCCILMGLTKTHL